MNKIVFLILFILFSANLVLAQRCANVAVKITKIQKVNKLQGRVFISNGDAITSVIEIYELSKSENKISPYKITETKTPVKTIETNQKGEFFLNDLAPKSYVLKVGTKDSDGFNCICLKIKLSRSGSSKPIEIELSLGT